MIDYLNTAVYRESDESFMLEDLIQKMQGKHDDLQAKLERAKEPYIYGEIDQMITFAISDLQKDAIYIEFLIGQENKNVHILKFKGQKQIELEEQLNYEKQIKNNQYQIGLLKDEFNKKLNEAEIRKVKYNKRMVKACLEEDKESIIQQKDIKIEKISKKIEDDEKEKQKYKTLKIENMKSLLDKDKTLESKKLLIESKLNDSRKF
jgi:hypothetical protein